MTTVDNNLPYNDDLERRRRPCLAGSRREEKIIQNVRYYNILYGAIDDKSSRGTDDFLLYTYVKRVRVSSLHGAFRLNIPV